MFVSRAQFVSVLIALYEKYGRRISSVALVVGFALDTITLKRIDLWIENLIFLAYLLIAVLSIIIINLYDGHVLRGKFFYYVSTFAPVPMQFAFGGLFSGFAIFYLRSASLSASWPFLFFLLLLLIGNEFFRARYLRLTFHISIFFIALFSYAVFLVPIIVGRMGVAEFLLSGAISLAAILIFLEALSIFMRKRVREALGTIIKSVGAIFLAMNISYFLNIIPPIPLALKEAGAYHFVNRIEDGSYFIRREGAAWYSVFFPTTVHLIRGDSLYFYSAVFAPTRLNIRIAHRWQYFDEGQDKWVTVLRVGFPISGGRDGGYRGFSEKTNIEEGFWRVDAETERGQRIGRKTFRIQHVNALPLLEERIE